MLYCFLVLANMDSIYQNNKDISLKKLILDNKKNNERMEKLVKNTEFCLLFLGKNGKIYDEKMKLLSGGIIPEKKNELKVKYFDKEILITSNDINCKKIQIINKLKNSKDIPDFINKETINFYSLYYPGMNKKDNLIYYYEYPSKEKSFFMIEDKFYDKDLNQTDDQNIFINENKKNIHRIMLFKYDKN